MEYKVSIGNIVNNVITMYGTKWALEIFVGEQFVKYVIV